MASSGTYAWGLSNGSVVLEAFERIGVSARELSREQMASANRSLQLELQAWSNRGINLWKVISGTINLVAGQAAYTMETDLVTLTDAYYTSVGTGGNGSNIDRILLPMTRTQYAMLPNKGQTGTPTQYWFERLSPAPLLTLWEVPVLGAPTVVVSWFGLQRIQDANVASAETPDVPYRGLDALCAALGGRLAMKFAPARFELMKAEALEAWNDFITNDQEDGPLMIAPNLSGYARMG